MTELRRVLAVTPEAVWVWQQGTVRRVAPSELPSVRVGDICRGGEIVARSQASDFPLHDGDFSRLSERGGLRFGAVRARSVLLTAIRAFFARRGFVEIDPPTLVHSPGLELHLDAVGVQLREGMGGAPVERWLSTSPEYAMKRLISCGFERIYSLGHAFRSGERGTHHNPEFSMLEWYRAGADYRAIVRDARALVRHCARALQSGGFVTEDGFDAEGSWLRLSVRQAIARYADFDPGRGDDVSLVRRRAQAAGLAVDADDGAAEVLVRALAERVEPALAQTGAVVIDRWPASMASLARRFHRAPHLAERFEIYVRGIEIANGFSELVDPDEQRLRFEADIAARQALGRPLYPIDERFLAALREGCPPAAGVALGVDRLLMLLCGHQDIDSVLAFPFERA